MESNLLEVHLHSRNHGILYVGPHSFYQRRETPPYGPVHSWSSGIVIHGSSISRFLGLLDCKKVTVMDSIRDAAVLEGGFFS